MIENNALIYNFKEHGLYYQTRIEATIEREVTFALDTIQMHFNYDTGNLLAVTGFLPLIRAVRQPIDIPSCVEGKFSISMKDIEYMTGIAYDYVDYFSESKVYLLDDDLPITYYDEMNKRILIGTQSKSDTCIKINKNIICGLDEDKNLKYLLIVLDTVIN